MKSVLAIDDDISTLMILAKLLEPVSYQVHFMTSGIGACEMIRKIAPAAVLLDVVMPEKGGMETLAEIQAEFPDLPVVAMSGDEASLGKMRHLGAQATLSKPFDTDTLIETLAVATGM
ncbi:MAG: Chemotaxis protein CheY [Pseudomonadota bacterium]|jgi:CheY-like chemotaxis protein